MRKSLPHYLLSILATRTIALDPRIFFRFSRSFPSPWIFVIHCLSTEILRRVRHDMGGSYLVCEGPHRTCREKKGIVLLVTTIPRLARFRRSIETTRHYAKYYGSKIIQLISLLLYSLLLYLPLYNTYIYNCGLIMS